MKLDEFLEKHSQAWLAGRLGITQSAVSQWLWKGVPAERVRDIVVASGGLVSAHELRPDLYPEGFTFPKQMIGDARAVET